MFAKDKSIQYAYNSNRFESESQQKNDKETKYEASLRKQMEEALGL
jgi:hypothetical protein